MLGTPLFKGAFVESNHFKLLVYVLYLIGHKFNMKSYGFIQDVSRLVDITAGGDFLGLWDQKSSYKHVSDFGRLRSYDRLNLRIEGNDY